MPASENSFKRRSLLRESSVGRARPRDTELPQVSNRLLNGMALMDHAVVPLTPSEEITFWRVKFGVAKPSQMNACDLARLKQLGLIKPRGLQFVLSDAGRSHLNVLAKPDEFFSRLIALSRSTPSVRL